MHPTNCDPGLRAALAAAVLLLARDWPAARRRPCRKGPVRTPPTAAAVPTQVEVVAAELRPWPVMVRVQGSLLADEHAVVGTKVAGRVQKVHVDLGSRVAAGDLLATLEPEDFDLQVREAEAQLEQARVNLGLKPGESEEQLDRKQTPDVAQEEALAARPASICSGPSRWRPTTPSRRKNWSNPRPTCRWPRPAAVPRRMRSRSRSP